ncbi:TPA: hypothetical protein ACTW95_001376 [Klebsiella quasipneumoniae subsp. similipneumoniae]
MSELDDMFSNRQEVAESIAKAQEMEVQTDDGNGVLITLEEQIAFAQSQE